MTDRRAAAVILAAGGSARLGRPKQLVELDGGPLIRRVVDTAIAAGCGPVVVVVGRDADACRAALADTPAVVVTNEDWPTGMGSSIRVGFAELFVPHASGPPTAGGTPTAHERRAFLLLCDQPRVTPDTLGRLSTAMDRSGKSVCVAEYAGTLGPPVLASGDALTALRDWPGAGGAKRLWTDRPADVCRVLCPEAAVDVDTPADVERLSR